ncbi:LysE family translocator [Rhodobacteraceae bacterium]|nr:LysE family translocator [Paracoccaceae bacterium]
MWSFILAVCLLLSTPGPGVLSLAGVGAAFGYRHGVRYLIGLFIGTNVVALGVITGLAALMLAEPGIRVALTLISAGYLLWLAFRIAFAGAKIAFIERPEPPGIRGGLLLQAVNPKAYVVNTTLFSGFVFWADHPALEMTAKLIILNVLWISIHIIWLWVGVTLQRMNLAPKVQRTINVGMALAMLVVVAMASLGSMT